MPSLGLLECHALIEFTAASYSVTTQLAISVVTLLHSILGVCKASVQQLASLFYITDWSKVK
jgi:hypothetical protein